MIDAGDAAVAESGEVDSGLDTGVENDGAQHPQDGGEQDAGDAAASACLDNDAVLGGECPNVVMCTEQGLCDLERNLCCVTQTSASCSPALNCDGQQRIRCDGPEDCSQGKVCCAREGATSCLAASECTGDAYRACHADSDCDGRRCLEGLPGMFGPFPVTYFAKAGLCRGL